MVDQLKLGECLMFPTGKLNVNCDAKRLRRKANKERVISEKTLPQPNDGHVLFTELEVKSALRSKEVSN